MPPPPPPAPSSRHPHLACIGAQVFVSGVAGLLDHLQRQAIANVRIFADAARLLLPALPAASLDRVFLLFPDPWPKHRHAARRFVCRDTLDRLALLMRPGAQLRTASDGPGLIERTLCQGLAHPASAWPPGDGRRR